MGVSLPSGAISWRRVLSSVQPAKRSSGSSRGLQVGWQAARAAQDDLDAGQQLARAEGLGQVVVGAHLQAHDAVGLVAACGEHHDGQVGPGAQVTTQRQAVVAGQHHVQHHQVEAATVQRLPHGAAVGHGGGALAVLFEIARQQAADLGVVVDDEDVVGSVHRCVQGPIAPGAACCGAALSYHSMSSRRVDAWCDKKGAVHDTAALQRWRCNGNRCAGVPGNASAPGLAPDRTGQGTHHEAHHHFRRHRAGRCFRLPLRTPSSPTRAWAWAWAPAWALAGHGPGMGQHARSPACATRWPAPRPQPPRSPPERR
jgi:hypothetical protein